MSRTTIQPLAGISSILPADVKHPTEAEIARIKEGCHELLLSDHCVENGTHMDRVHDPDWSHDIGFIVDQVVPRRKVYKRESGLFVTVERILQLASLRCEVDYRGEICCWLYTHSNEDI